MKLTRLFRAALHAVVTAAPVAGAGRSAPNDLRVPAGHGDGAPAAGQSPPPVLAYFARKPVVVSLLSVASVSSSARAAAQVTVWIWEGAQAAVSSPWASATAIIV